MSDILIKGMEMPKNCGECAFYIDGACYGKGYRDYRSIMDTAKPDDCPLIELPPHGRLIDVSTVEEIRFHDADGYHVINGEQLCELEIDAEIVIEAEGSET